MFWISLFELIVLIISAILIIPQIYLLKKQLKDSHEECRRKNTVNFMEKWSNSLKKDTSVAEQVARGLNREQCQKLYKHQPFEVSKKVKKEICKFCPLKDTGNSCADCSLNDDNAIVDGKILTELRWHVITYLNTLETLLVAWHLGIVDKDTIKEQFAFVSDQSKGLTLSEFRHSAGGYPVIEKFIDEIKPPSSPSKSEL